MREEASGSWDRDPYIMVIWERERENLEHWDSCVQATYVTVLC